jgi:hypothetical protein
MNFKSESGNVLVYILIAVALFAALGFAVSNMMRSSGSTVSGEKDVVFVSETLNYAKTLRDMVQYLRISKNCSENQISFEHSPFDGTDSDYVNPNAPSDFSCHLFHPKGGAMGYQAGANEVNGAINWIFTGTNDGENVGNQCDMDSCADLMAILPDVSKALCRKINETLGIAADNNFMTQEDNNFEIDPFQGSYTYEARLSDEATLDALDGRSLGCVRGNTSPQDVNKYYFYQVLLAR